MASSQRRRPRKKRSRNPTTVAFVVFGVLSAAFAVGIVFIFLGDSPTASNSDTLPLDGGPRSQEDGEGEGARVAQRQADSAVPAWGDDRNRGPQPDRTVPQPSDPNSSEPERNDRSEITAGGPTAAPSSPAAQGLSNRPESETEDAEQTLPTPKPVGERLFWDATEDRPQRLGELRQIRDFTLDVPDNMQVVFSDGYGPFFTFEDMSSHYHPDPTEFCPVYDMRSSEQIGQIPRHGSGKIRLSPDGRFAAASVRPRGRSWAIISTRTGKHIAEDLSPLNGLEKDFTFVQPNRLTRTVWNGELIVETWALDPPRKTAAIRMTKGYDVSAPIAVSPTGIYCALYFGTGKVIRIYDLSKGECVAQSRIAHPLVEPESVPCFGLAFSPDGKELAGMFGHPQQTIKLVRWEMRTGKMRAWDLRDLVTNGQGRQPYRNIVWSSGLDGLVLKNKLILDRETSQPLWVFPKHSNHSRLVIDGSRAVVMEKTRSDYAVKTEVLPTAELESNLRLVRRGRDSNLGKIALAPLPPGKPKVKRRVSPLLGEPNDTDVPVARIDFTAQTERADKDLIASVISQPVAGRGPGWQISFTKWGRAEPYYLVRLYFDDPPLLVETREFRSLAEAEQLRLQTEQKNRRKVRVVSQRIGTRFELQYRFRTPVQESEYRTEYVVKHRYWLDRSHSDAAEKLLLFDQWIVTPIVKAKQLKAKQL